MGLSTPFFISEFIVSTNSFFHVKHSLGNVSNISKGLLEDVFYPPEFAGKVKIPANHLRLTGYLI